MGGGSSSSNLTCHTDQTDRINGCKQDIYDLIDDINKKRKNLNIVDYQNLINGDFKSAVKNQFNAQAAHDPYKSQQDEYNRLVDYQGGSYQIGMSDLNKALTQLYSTLQARQKKEADRKAALDGYVNEYIVKEKAISNLQSQINTQTYNVNMTSRDITNAKTALKNSLNVADYNNKKVNDQKKEIIDASYTIAYYEHLLYEAYLNIYNAVNIQNLTLRNNLTMKDDQYSTDNSLYIYQKNRIDFYKNINTFLFYFYYLLIIILIIIIIKGNDSAIIVKLTLFRLFVVMLILYPLFIIRFQNFIYFVAKLVYTHLFMYDNMTHFETPVLTTNIKA
jgi:hypothetical protein